MAKKKTQIPKYGTITLKGIQYYRTRITDADGKELSLYAATCEELYEKQLEARKQVEEIIFHRQHPTVAEYGEKWLLMQSAKVSASTLRGYTRDMTNYIIKPLGEMYMEEVTADDIRLALVPLSKKSEGLYNKVNMLLKCIFYAAERNQILEHNPCAGISGKGGKPTKKKEALTDQQVAVLLDTVKGLPPYLFIMLGLYSGLRREEILALQWDCVFLDEDTPYLSVRRAWRTEHNRPVISTVLKTPAAKRDIPIPKCLVDCLRETKRGKDGKGFIDTLMLPPCLVPSYRHRPMMNSHRAFFIYRRILNEQYRNQHRHLPDCQKADRQDNLYRACAFQPDRQGDDGGQNQAYAS